MKLTAQQQGILDQIKQFVESDASVFILRGYAGTGKTTMTQVIANYIGQRRKVVLMAPTGRASHILSPKTGQEATTIHKAIYDGMRLNCKHSHDVADAELQFVFPISQRYKDEKIVAIVDEASMVCSKMQELELLMFGTNNLMQDLLTFVRPSFGGKIIFVGDPAQLPPVGETTSQALNADYFEQQNLKVMQAELTEVLRQTNDSVILKNAMALRDLLTQEQRNRLVFEEKKNDVEHVSTGDFLNKYIEHYKRSETPDSVIICYSNKMAYHYNQAIRRALYGQDVPLQAGDVLLVAQNNYHLERMNGELLPVLEVGEQQHETVPVMRQVGGQKQRIHIALTFREVLVPNGKELPTRCLLLENLLTSAHRGLSIDEQRALYIFFCIRHPELRKGTLEFTSTLLQDPYFNALRAKYGYAVTGHKCQGGEWDEVFVDYAGRTGLSDDSLRWAYTATTRARKTLYFTNRPRITPFSTFRIESIQKCKNMAEEYRIVAPAETTPYHDEKAPSFLKAKYHCIAEQLECTPYRIQDVASKPYLEIYHILTPESILRFDLHYKQGGIFSAAKATQDSPNTSQICAMLDNEASMPLLFNYCPSEGTCKALYDLLRSVCDDLAITITNVVEHKEDFSVVYYLRTCGTFSYIKFYINSHGFVTYAKPLSLKGTEDKELAEVIRTIQQRLT